MLNIGLKAAALGLALFSSGSAFAQSPPLRPTAGSAYIVVTGGTAVVAVTGPVNGCYIYNSASATDQNVALEDIFVDPVQQPTQLLGINTTSRISSGGVWFCGTNLPPGGKVWVNAATSGHRFNVVVW